MPRETTPVWLRKWVSLQIRRDSIPNKLWWVNWIQLCFFELCNKPCKKHYKPRQNNLESTEKVIPPFILQLFYYCFGPLVGTELLCDTGVLCRIFLCWKEIFYTLEDISQHPLFILEIPVPIRPCYGQKKMSADIAACIQEDISS